jgi:signal transduction histidine kinase
MKNEHVILPYVTTNTNSLNFVAVHINVNYPLMGMHQTKRIVYKILGGGIQLLKEAATQRGVKIRILTPEDKMNVEIERKLTMVQERLFTKFATKSTTITGLGLYISNSIVEAHGGKIWGKNNYPKGQGATFGFSLPLE